MWETLVLNGRNVSTADCRVLTLNPRQSADLNMYATVSLGAGMVEWTRKGILAEHAPCSQRAMAASALRCNFWASCSHSSPPSGPRWGKVKALSRLLFELDKWEPAAQKVTEEARQSLIWTLTAQCQGFERATTSYVLPTAIPLHDEIINIFNL